MSQIDMKERVRSLALLARLELKDSEIETFATQLSQILSYVEQLQTVSDADSVAPLFHPLDIPTAMRKDEVLPPLKNKSGHPKVLDSAPDVLYDGYKVPAIL